LHFIFIYRIAAAPALAGSRPAPPLKQSKLAITPLKELNMTQPTLEQIAASPILDALDKNKQAAETVEQAAHDLAVVHAVLDKGVPAEARTGDMDQAVTQTSELEKRLSQSVELLQEVNQTLVAELEARPPAETATP
jgi:hypothetical protein